MLDHTMEETLATLEISEDVFVKIAEKAALEVDGVLSISTRHPSFKESFLSTKMDIKEIDINFLSDVVEVEISIIVESSARVVSVSKKVQKSVKDSIQNMTGIPVAFVKVEVANMAYVVDSNGKISEGLPDSTSKSLFEDTLLYLKDFELEKSPEETEK